MSESDSKTLATDTPTVQVTQRFAAILVAAQQLPAIPTAVVYPTSKEALLGALLAAQEQLIKPIFVGPEPAIQQLAQQLEVDLAPYEIRAVDNSQAAAEMAVALANAGKVGMILKGSLHTDELMRAAVDKDKGLRVQRRMSHAFVLDVPAYHKLLIITDCALNISPDLVTKRDIAQNAIDLAHAMQIAAPKVAVLSAVETVNPKIPTTVEAAALAKMAERSQITGGLVDGPLALDNAISKQSAKIKQIHSKVAGEADILLMPNLEMGNSAAKLLEYLGQSRLAGLVMGARIPIALTSRADDPTARLVSCALGVLYAAYLQRDKV